MSVIKAGNGNDSNIVVRLTVLDLSNPLVHKCYPLSTTRKGEGIGVIIAQPGPKFDQYWCWAPEKLFKIRDDINDVYGEDGPKYALEVFKSDDFKNTYRNSSIELLHKYLPEDFVYNPEETVLEVFKRYFPDAPIATQEQIDAIK